MQCRYCSSALAVLDSALVREMAERITMGRPVELPKLAAAIIVWRNSGGGQLTLAAKMPQRAPMETQIKGSIKNGHAVLSSSCIGGHFPVVGQLNMFEKSKAGMVKFIEIYDRIFRQLGSRPPNRRRTMPAVAMEAAVPTAVNAFSKTEK